MGELNVRNMSFALTTPQILDRSKTVTRRLGWEALKPGTLVQAVEKAQGLKKGETVRKLAVIRATDVRREPLSRLIDDLDYGLAEVAKEGFGDHPWVQGSAHGFVELFCNANRPCEPSWTVTRIEFEYVEEQRHV
jgi:hypothetical protein